MKTATLIYNPVAGGRPARREKQIQEAARLLNLGGIAARLSPTTEPGSAEALARAAVGGGEELVLVCGGDGTINEVVNGMIPGKATLGILPGGTANILAKELHLPHDPARAARELPGWKPRRLALGLATWAPAGPAGAPSGPKRRYFLAVAGVGFDAHIVRELRSGFKMAGGVAAYVLEAFRQLFRYSFPQFICSAEGTTFRASFAVAHRSSRYAGWLRMAPGADLFGERITLSLFESSSRARFLLYAAAVMVRQHTRFSDVRIVQTQVTRCAPAQPGTTIFFELDGELAGQLPATFEAVPDALTLLVPAR